MAGMAGVGTLRLSYAPRVGEVVAGDNARGVDSFDEEIDEFGYCVSLDVVLAVVVVATSSSILISLPRLL